MNNVIWNGCFVAIGALALAACGAPAETTEDNETGEAEAGAADLSAEGVARLECESLGDVAVWIETPEAGPSVLVTHMQSEMAPDAQPDRLPLEPTGASAGRAGTRLSDAEGEYMVWMMDDGTATVKAGEIEVSCKS